MMSVHLYTKKKHKSYTLCTIVLEVVTYEKIKV